MIKVDYNHFEIGKIYYIETLENCGSNCRHYGIFTGYIHTTNNCLLAYFKDIKNIPNSSSGVSEIEGHGYRTKSWKFYECKKYNIYQEMERRALRLILIDIIGDKSFITYLEKIL